MNKEELQLIANRLLSSVKSSNPNVRYHELMGLVGDLNSAISKLKDDNVIEETPSQNNPISKKKKTSKKKKSTTKD
tara:strand:- start:445 stop:672 length:228 start_codon:yes stop_codon:yes gene_type:complete